MYQIKKKIIYQISEKQKSAQKESRERENRRFEWEINTETDKYGMLHVLLSLAACPSSIKYQ